jgi:hypothetical protein
MRSTILKFAAAIAVVAASAAPALACDRSCGLGYGVGYDYGYAGVAEYERLPDPGRYYYVNQGPAFSGPGNFAPYPTYQETAISGPRGYNRPNYGYYDGGPYGNATNHYSWAQPAYRGPAIYSYRPRVRSSYRYGYRTRPAVRYGQAPRSYASRYGTRGRFAGPRVIQAPRQAVTAPYEYRGPERRIY